MLKKILIPLDGSKLSERALSLATALSIPTAARLLLVRVVASHSFPGVDEREPQVQALTDAEIYLREVASGLIKRGFEVELATPYGEPPAERIIEEVGLRHADLIVMTTHGRTGPRRWVFGSVAEAVVARSPVPVLLQRAWDPGRRSMLLEERPRLLVPLDGTAFADAALPVATALADDLGAELVRLEVDPADGAAAIVAGAEDAQACLIVMATHGRSGIRRTALGSISGRVLQEGIAPLVLVRNLN